MVVYIPPLQKFKKKSLKPGHLYAKIILILNTQNWYSTTKAMLASGMLTFSPIKYFLSYQIGTPPLSWFWTIPFFSKRRFLKHTLCTFSFLEYPRKLRNCVVVCTKFNLELEFRMLNLKYCIQFQFFNKLYLLIIKIIKRK